MPEHREQQWRQRIEARSRGRGLALARDVVDELVAHLADAYDSERDGGASHESAMAAIARLIDEGRYLDVAKVQGARSADSRLLRRATMDNLTSGIGFDVRYAWRSMRRHATLTTTVIAIMAIGIGATTAAFAVIHGVVLKPLAYPSAHQLVVLKHGTAPNEGGAFAAADWLDYAANHKAFAGLAAYSSWPMNLSGAGEPERLRSVIVSGNFFDVIATPAALGRTIAPRDDAASIAPVVVLSDALWRRRFGADPAVIGRTVLINMHAAAIVGVMPPGFAIPNDRADLWMPMGLSPDVLRDRDGEWLSLIGRLQPDAAPVSVQADLSTMAARLALAYPRPSRDPRIVVRPLADEMIAGARRVLWLGGLAALFVLIASLANAANLLLTRATTRRDEIALRSALGAEPARLARQLLVESALFAAAGGVLGGVLSWVFLRTFSVMAMDRVPRVEQIHFDAPAVAAASAMAVLAALAVGGCTAWLVTRWPLRDMKETNTLRVARPTSIQGWLLATQVAFAMVLVTGTALVVSSYVATLRVDPGFDTSDTETMQLTLPRSSYRGNESHIRFAASALEALSAVPGVVSVGVVSDLPFEANATHFAVSREGEPPSAARMTTIRLADPGFFRTLRVPLIDGRSFDDRDRAGSVNVAILNRTAASRFGSTDHAIGQRVRASGDVERTIVGIVGDIKHAGLHADEGPVLYVPYAQKTSVFLNWLGIVVRAPGAAPPVSVLKRVIAQIDPNQPIEAVRSMSSYLDREAAPYRFSSMVVGSLAGVALLLALTGIYGLTTFVVGRRRRELALRLALGASGSAIVMTVARQIAIVLVLGGAAGVAGSLFVIRIVGATVPEPAPAGASLSTAAAAWVAIAVAVLAAALGPALRGARLDPRAALQSE